MNESQLTEKLINALVHTEYPLGKLGFKSFNITSGEKLIENNDDLNNDWDIYFECGDLVIEETDSKNLSTFRSYYLDLSTLQLCHNGFSCKCLKDSQTFKASFYF